MSDINDILNELKRVEEKLNVYIPSLKKDVEFKALTLLQQKNVIDKASSNVFGIIDFYNSIFNLIKSSTTYDIANFNTIDRINIILSLIKNISPIYNDIDINGVLEKNKTLQLPELEKTLKTDKFTFTVAAPSLATDYSYNNYVINNFRQEKTLMGKLLINEVSKFIKVIIVNETGQVIDLTNQSVKNTFAIVESLDTKQLKEVFEYITSIRDIEVEFVKADGKQIEIGPELFVM